jgi:hypothetical protein
MRFSGVVLFSEFSKGLSHVQEARLVLRVGNLLRQPDAFRGISTIIDGGK